jgi:hypothetical protein
MFTETGHTRTVRRPENGPPPPRRNMEPILRSRYGKGPSWEWAHCDQSARFSWYLSIAQVDNPVHVRSLAGLTLEVRPAVPTVQGRWFLELGQRSKPNKEGGKNRLYPYPRSSTQTWIYSRECYQLLILRVRSHPHSGLHMETSSHIKLGRTTSQKVI